MLDLRTLVAAPETVIRALENRGMGALQSVVHSVIELDARRREVLAEVEALKAQRNQASVQIAQKKKRNESANELMDQMKAVSQRIKEQDPLVDQIDKQLRQLLLELPNLPDDSVPVGRSADQNVVVREWGKIPSFDFSPLTHDIMGERLGEMDFKKAGEVTGARFVFLKGSLARLERALIQFMLDTHSQSGYQEIHPPFLVNRAALTGTGQLPKFEEDVFHIEKFDFFLIPTAEVPVTNYHRDQILSHEQLPLKYCAYTPCFRSEAGSYGKDTKGLKRQHQFNKVELVKFVEPDKGFEELESLTQDAERILQLLGLPYRVVSLCSGDLGFGSVKTYDIEVWSPGAGTYMEISSCSCFTDYQARRASIRYRSVEDKKVKYVYTLNGSGLAVGRTMIALMENYQTADGSFSIPEALKEYL